MHLEAREDFFRIANVKAVVPDIDGTAFRPDLAADDLKRMLPAALESAERAQHNLVIRPRGATLVQLDDLDSTKLHRVAPLAFLTVQTSPANYQGWIAVEGGTPDIARRLRQGIGADLNASGSIRLAGSRNFKPKYGPDYPLVAVTDATPGRIVNPQQLQDMGLLAPKQERTWVERVSRGRPRRWPDYKRCLAGAPPNHAGEGVDVSRADFLWCRISAQTGWNIEDTAARLMELSSKARENGESYATRTARNAAISVSIPTSPLIRGANHTP